MDMTSQIAFERAWAKAHRLPQEERAIAPVGRVAYIHGVAAGEAKNRDEAFASDMEFRDEAQAEKSREFGLLTEEKGRQVSTDLDQRYTQAVQEMDERERQFGGRLEWTGERTQKTLGEQERQFGGRLEWTGERTQKTLGEQERQFGGRLTASGSQFDRRIASESDIFGRRLGASSYESGMLYNQKMTQFEQELAFRAQKFDDEIAWGREKFDRTLSFQDRVFLDKMANERRQLDTWIQSNRIGAVIELGNTVVSAYGMKKGIEQRKAQTAEIQSLRNELAGQKNTLANKAAVEGIIDDINTAYKTEKYKYDPNALLLGKYFISDPVQQGTMNVSHPITYSEFAESYDRMKISSPYKGHKFSHM